MDASRLSATLTIEGIPGDIITECAERMVKVASESGCQVVAVFNGIALWAEPSSTVKDIVDHYYTVSNARSAARKAEPTFAETS